jgi:hypothetical protein
MTTQSEIAKRAYTLWEQSGRPEGKDFEYWLKAEAEAQSASPENKPSRADALAKSAKVKRSVS